MQAKNIFSRQKPKNDTQNLYYYQLYFMKYIYLQTNKFHDQKRARDQLLRSLMFDIITDM